MRYLTNCDVRFSPEGDTNEWVSFVAPNGASTNACSNGRSLLKLFLSIVHFSIKRKKTCKKIQLLFPNYQDVFLRISCQKKATNVSLWCSSMLSPFRHGPFALHRRDWRQWRDEAPSGGQIDFLGYVNGIMSLPSSSC